MPTRAQMEKMARAVGRSAPPVRSLAPEDDLPSEYWQALLDDPSAGRADPGPGSSGRLLRLSQIPQHLLRVGLPALRPDRRDPEGRCCPALRAGRYLEGGGPAPAGEHVHDPDGSP